MTTHGTIFFFGSVLDRLQSKWSCYQECYLQNRCSMCDWNLKWIQARIVEDCSAESTPSSVCDIVVFYIKGALVCVRLQCRCYQYCIIIIQAIAIKMKFYQGWIGDQTVRQDSVTFGFYSISSSSTRPQLLQLLPVTVTIDSRKFRRLTPSDVNLQLEKWRPRLRQISFPFLWRCRDVVVRAYLI